ncbi:MAG: OsmC family protein [Acidimicrobiales bacterium]
MASTHRHVARCSWAGSTGAGYLAHSRTHQGGARPATAHLTLSSDPAFGGDATLLNPEQLVVLAAASCQLLSFLAVAARARVDVIAYEDEAEGEMPEDDPPVRLTRIVLRPRITLGVPVSGDRARHLIRVAHRECYIANSLRADVVVEPTFVVPQ